jgi:Protein of unknown function (DUF4058)
MPIHDWTRVDPGIFHDFHHAWIEEVKRSLNRGLLPPDYYALAEQIASHLGPDVLTLHKPARKPARRTRPGGGITLAVEPPKVRYHSRADREIYAARAKSVVIRHRSKHEVIALVEIVSPGNKASARDLKAFVQKAHDALAAGVHLLIVDLFPPTSRDPEGIHQAIWEDRGDALPFSKKHPLTTVAYLAAEYPEAFVEPLRVGEPLVDMPLFLSLEQYVPVPLEATYQAAWEAVPEVWRDVVSGE